MMDRATKTMLYDLIVGIAPLVFLWASNPLSFTAYSFAYMLFFVVKAAFDKWHRDDPNSVPAAIAAQAVDAVDEAVE